jgi:hypothetical protein
MRPKRVTGLELQIETGRTANSLGLELVFELKLESSFTPLLKINDVYHVSINPLSRKLRPIKCAEIHLAMILSALVKVENPGL